MHIPTRDLHLVIEATHVGQREWAYRVVTPALGWHDAQAEWDRADEARRTGPTPNDGSYLMVRSVDDPRWAHLPRPIARADHHNTTSGRFTSGLERAAKDYAKSVGVAGRKGGWIYSAGGSPICQGWDSYARRCSRHLRTIKLTDGTTLAWALTALPEAELEVA